MNNLEQNYMTIPLGDTAHGHARKFAQLQATPDQAIQFARELIVTNQLLN